MKTIYESDELKITKHIKQFRVIDKISDHLFELDFFGCFCDKHGNKINKWDFCKQYPAVMPILIDLGELEKWKNGFKIKTDGDTHYFDMQMIYEIAKYTCICGHACYYKYDKLHRTDGPAVEYANGEKQWWINGKFHRLDAPAVEYADGEKQWYIDGKHHRIDGPAVEYANGEKRWYIDGNLHRTDGPAIEDANGEKRWYIDGNLHRTDGPAIEYADGGKQWYINDKLHRTDGPAMEYANGGKQWWINDKKITGAKQWMAENNYTVPFDKSVQAAFILTFAG